MKRIIVQDKYNDIKIWEVTKLSGGFYLKQFYRWKTINLEKEYIIF